MYKKTNNEISNPTKINIRNTVEAAVPRKNVRNNIKSFDSNIFISPVKAKQRNINDLDVAMKQDKLISYESYIDPPLLKHNIFKRIIEEFGSNYSVVGKEMVQEIESKILVKNDDTLLLKYIKQHYPVTLRMPYEATYFCKEYS